MSRLYADGSISHESWGDLGAEVLGLPVLGQNSKPSQISRRRCASRICCTLHLVPTTLCELPYESLQSTLWISPSELNNFELSHALNWKRNANSNRVGTGTSKGGASGCGCPQASDNCSLGIRLTQSRSHRSHKVLSHPPCKATPRSC